MSVNTIKIDDDVLNYLKINAVPYVELNPNDTLRRLLCLDKDEGEDKDLVKDGDPLVDIVNRMLAEVREGKKTKITSGKKRKKVNLGALLDAHYIRDGEELFFVDYGKKKISNESAIISRKNNGLIYSDESYSMSSLANELLNKYGFSTSATRGPLHWVNAKSESIHDLWEKHIQDIEG